MNHTLPGDALIERLKIAAKCKGYTELVVCLNIRRAWLTKSRREGVLHPAIRNNLLKMGLNPDWIYTQYLLAS